MKLHNLYTWAAALMIVAMLLPACTQASPSIAPTQVATTAQTVEVKPTEVQPAQLQSTSTTSATPKVVTIIITQEPDALTHYYSNQYSTTVANEIWNCWAWSYDDQNKPFPRLVKEIPSVENGGVSKDGLTITMHLRDDIVWSDGEPITADDFVFTYKMIINKANTVISVYPYDKISSVDAPDAHTVVIKFTEPFAPWQTTLWHGMMPKHVLQPVFDKDGTLDKAEWNRAPTVGCGPFVFDKWESGSYTSFVKNPKYWLGQPKIDEIFFRYVPDDASQTAALINKDADIGLFISNSDIPALEKEGINIVKVASGYNEGWFFNFRDMGNPALKDVRVRQALIYAFDRDAINKDLMAGLTKTPATFWDSLPQYVDPSLKPYPFDPEKAKSLLDEAGWKDTDGDGVREDAKGNKLTLKMGATTRAIRQDVQVVAQQQLKNVGVNLELSNVKSDIFFADLAHDGPMAKGTLDIMEFSDKPKFPDPDSEYWLCAQIPSAQNPTGLNYYGCDEKLDKMLQEQSKMTDTTERIAKFQEITKYMYDQAYWMGVWEDPDLWATSARLQGVKLSGVTPFYNILDWDLKG